MNVYHRVMKFVFKHLDKIIGRFYKWCSKKYMYHDVMVVPSEKELKQQSEWWEKFREENGLGSK